MTTGTVARAAEEAVTVAPAHPPGRGDTHRALSTTPQRLRAFAVVSVVLVAALAVLLGLAVREQRGGLDTIGERAAPTVVAGADLYFALNDMDAQLANALLVGEDQTLGFTRAQALAIFEQRRRQADQDLQVVAAAGGDQTVQARVRRVFDLLGDYEALAAQTVLLAQQVHAPAGHPGAAALATYRQATDLLATGLLPAMHALVDGDARVLDRTYRDRRAGALTARTWVGLVGAALVVVLGAFQWFLLRRFHRLVSPALAAATVVALALTVGGAGTLSDEAGHLSVAKKDAFDSVLALSQARAVSYDANADESRYLVDPERAQRYQDAYLAKSRQLVDLSGATIATFDADFATEVRRYQDDHADVGWDGFFGTEFRNITFNGERAAAETMLLRYQTYQADDRQIRRLATGGHLDQAIAFCTSYETGRSNYTFDQYDKALAALIAINTGAFDQAMRDGRADLNGWRLTAMGAAACAVVVLVLLGVSRRLAEYR